MGVGDQRHTPAALPPGKTLYPLYRRLGGSQGRSGHVRKISPSPGFDPRTVQPLASRYAYCAIPARSRSSNSSSSSSSGHAKAQVVARQLLTAEAWGQWPKFRPDPARKLSANLYDINHCCVYSERILMMDRGTVRNM